MASISPGSLGTFKSTTAEGRLIEIVTYLDNLERNATNNPEAKDAISWRIDSADQAFSGTFSLPAQQAIGVGGVLQISALPYITGGNLSPGGDAPTFVSAVPEAHLLEVLMTLQGWEANATRNPNNYNYITGTYNSDSRLYQGTFKIPVTTALETDGSLKVVAAEYLSDLP